MTQVLDRPRTDVDLTTETVPVEIEREPIRQLPPPMRRRTYGLLGWALAVVAVLVAAFLVYQEVTADDPLAIDNWTQISGDLEWREEVEIRPYITADFQYEGVFTTGTEALEAQAALVQGNFGAVIDAIDGPIYPRDVAVTGNQMLAAQQALLHQDFEGLIEAIEGNIFPTDFYTGVGLTAAEMVLAQEALLAGNIEGVIEAIEGQIYPRTVGSTWAETFAAQDALAAGDFEGMIKALEG